VEGQRDVRGGPAPGHRPIGVVAPRRDQAPRLCGAELVPDPISRREGPSGPWTDADPDADFRVEPGETTEQILQFYRDQFERSRAIAAKASLDDLASEWPADRPPEKRPNLRWIYIHMIEETARHAGHLDVVRELIDGTTGD
jgi:uncharacterized protein DUF664